MSTPRQDLLLGYWDELISERAERLEEARARDLAVIRTAGVPYHYIAGHEVPGAYQTWLKAALPGIAITVMADATHFAYLTRPAEVAEILMRTTVPR
jgi:pimeloyl-ACP methyl ester carboxylesterase